MEGNDWFKYNLYNTCNGDNYLFNLVIAWYFERYTLNIVQKLPVMIAITGHSLLGHKRAASTRDCLFFCVEHMFGS